MSCFRKPGRGMSVQFPGLFLQGRVRALEARGRRSFPFWNRCLPIR